MIRNCTPQDNPLPPFRDWYDPWVLMFEMIAFAVGAVAILIIDLVNHFTGGLHIDDVMHGFKQRMDMVYTTVPFYLQQLEDVKAYNEEVKKHGIQTDKEL